MVLSWDAGTDPGEIRTMIVTAPRRAEPAPQEAPPQAANASLDPLALFGAQPEPAPVAREPAAPVRAPAAAPTRAAATPAAARAVAAPPAARFEAPQAMPAAPVAAGVRADAPAPRSADVDALLAAFLEGAGIPEQRLPGGLTPETMRQVGTVLREAVQGTLALLLARTAIKHEMRAEMTMIVARENNPLKFSPNVEAALAHLLGPQARGFMPPVKAMRDAYHDLRAHEFAVMAGMRAALAGVLARFDTTRLERRLTQKSVVDSLLPMNRKAKLWDLFSELYGDLSREAADDFQALFGKEFTRAYEAQIDKLDKDEPIGR